MGIADRLLNGTWGLALGPGDVEGLVRGLVPGLLLRSRVTGASEEPDPWPARESASMTSPVPEGSWLGGASSQSLEGTAVILDGSGGKDGFGAFGRSGCSPIFGLFGRNFFRCRP